MIPIPLKYKNLTVDTYSCYGKDKIGTVSLNLYNISSLEKRKIHNENNYIIELTTYSDECFYLCEADYQRVSSALKQLED